MRTIYLDSDFKCHVSNDGTMIPIEVDIFDNKCDAFIEGYRYVPEGESWTRYDGVVFYGEMITPCVDYKILDAAQRDYERYLFVDAISKVEEYETMQLELNTAYNEGVNSI